MTIHSNSLSLCRAMNMNSKLLCLFPELFPIHLRKSRSFRDISLRPIEDVLEILLFKFFLCLCKGLIRKSCLTRILMQLLDDCRHVLEFNQGWCSQNDSLGYHVFQFSNVPRPSVTEQFLHHFRRKPHQWFRSHTEFYIYIL